jgi:DNA (cytosine-5)-methyltransferase 1
MPATDLAHPRKDRPLSIEEYKRIQEFPDDWIIQGSLIQQYKQVGNAVPISLGKAVGRLIMQLINGEEVREFDDFRYSRYKNTSDAQWSNEFQKQIRKHAMANS